MALFDNPPHRCTILGPPTVGRDDGGGTSITHGTTKQADVPCSINTVSSSERDLFAQQGITVSHKVAFKSSTLTTALARGDKITASGLTYAVMGIEAGRSYGSIPAFTYATVQQQL